MVDNVILPILIILYSIVIIIQIISAIVIIPRHKKRIESRDKVIRGLKKELDNIGNIEIANRCLNCNYGHDDPGKNRIVCVSYGGCIYKSNVEDK